MNTKLQASIDRAIPLLRTSRNYDEYVCLKIAPEAGGCCCFHCWPYTWKEVNKTIEPFGPIEDEGDVLIETGDGAFVLECHESGPEIVTAINAGVDLIRSIIDLVVTILKSKWKDTRRNTGKIVLTKRTLVGTQCHEERIIEVDLPLNSSLEKILTTELKKTFGKKEPNQSVNRIARKSGSR